jgi:L-threonylcarbamoyladenylate synthase
MDTMWSENTELKEVLRKGGVAVMPTDTIYGIVGSALDVSTVNRIYNIRKRNPEKPCIILIGDIFELDKFSIILTEEQKKVLEKYWFTMSKVEAAEPTSIILDCPEEKFSYLHRGTKTLAFRLPASKDLQNLLKETGPVVAPSANPEGLPPSQNISEAKNYFRDLVDLYVDGGEIEGKPSKVIQLHTDGSATVLRA